MKWINYTNGDYGILSTEILVVPVDPKARKEYRVFQGEIDAGIFPSLKEGKLLATTLFEESV